MEDDAGDSSPDKVALARIMAYLFLVLPKI